MPQSFLKDVPKSQLLAALKRFDQQVRHQVNIDETSEQRYVAVNDKKIYPVKQIVALATGINEANFTEDEAVKFLSRNQIQVKLKGQTESDKEPNQPGRPSVSRYYDSYLLKLQIEKFKREYISFRSKKLLKEEINYKIEASQNLITNIRKDVLKKLIESGDFDEAKSEIKRCYYGNNLFNPFDTDPIHNADPEKLTNSLYNLLYSEQPFAVRFDNWVNLLSNTADRKTVWPTATFYLALFDPNKYLYVKPKPFNDFLTNVHSGLKWEAHTNFVFYSELIKLGKMLLQEPEIQNLRAVNLIDIQSFIWVLRKP